MFGAIVQARVGLQERLLLDVFPVLPWNGIPVQHSSDLTPKLADPAFESRWGFWSSSGIYRQSRRSRYGRVTVKLSHQPAQSWKCVMAGGTN